MGVTTRALTVEDWQQWRLLRLKALADAPAAFGSGLSEWIDATDERWRSRVRDVPLNLNPPSDFLVDCRGPWSCRVWW